MAERLTGASCHASRAIDTVSWIPVSHRVLQSFGLGIIPGQPSSHLNDSRVSYALTNTFQAGLICA